MKSKGNSQTGRQGRIEDALWVHDLADKIDYATPSVDCRCLLLCVSGCKTEWDEIRCWLRADVGQVVNVSCSEVFQHFSSKQGQPNEELQGVLLCIKVMWSKCTALRNPILAFRMCLFWAFFPVMTLKPTLVWHACSMAPWHIGGVIKWVTDAFISSETNSILVFDNWKLLLPRTSLVFLAN